MPPEEFRRHGREVVDWIADYLAGIDDIPVFPSIRPGDVAGAIPAAPPAEAEPMGELLEDFRSIVVPGINHWNHPSFHGYFSVSASGPGILGEMLASALNVNAMVWRSAPAASELEDVATDWLRQLLGLPAGFEGVINDTASTSTMYALTAAREAAYPDAHRAGLFGQPRGRVYASEHAHSSVEKGVLTIGLGQDGFRAIPTDGAYRMDPRALAAALEEDVAAGLRPVAIVPTLGTTSTASLDPVGPIADLAERHGAWLHVDAAYGGPAVMVPEAAHWFQGWERADSIVVNPHKWLFTPIDCSVLYCRRPEVLRAAFSVVPEYLRTAEQADARSLMDYGVALGRRFRALKLWFVLRYFGSEGIAARIADHLAIANELAAAIEEEEGWEVTAPVHLGLVTFRRVLGGDPAEDDRATEAVMDRINRSGTAFLSHTVLDGRTVIRLAVGNIKTTRAHVMGTWDRLREAAREG